MRDWMPNELEKKSQDEAEEEIFQNGHEDVSHFDSFQWNIREIWRRILVNGLEFRVIELVVMDLVTNAIISIIIDLHHLL